MYERALDGCAAREKMVNAYEPTMKAHCALGESSRDVLAVMRATVQLRTLQQGI